jgi:energy-coupling factor transporter ATP-binding protein EcfA2
MQGIIKTRNNKAKAPYTILLVGETGVGKSALLEFIANVLEGNDTDHYDLNILNHTNEQDRSNNQSQTNAAHLYELRSNDDIAVSVGICEHENTLNLFSSFAFSTPLGSSTLAVFRKTSCTIRVLHLKLRSTSTLSLPFLSSSMVPSRAAPSASTPCCPLYPPSSPNH